jgi:hypothetical protein
MFIILLRLHFNYDFCPLQNHRGKILRSQTVIQRVRYGQVRNTLEYILVYSYFCRDLITLSVKSGFTVLLKYEVRQNSEVVTNNDIKLDNHMRK